MAEIVFTPAAVLELLTQISELSEYEISLDESSDGDIQLRIGDSVYHLNTSSAEDVYAPKASVDAISEIADEAYQDLIESDPYVDRQDVVESGLLKSLAKTLLVGGLVRLTAKLLK